MPDEHSHPGDGAAAAWLAGGGEMGARIRRLDWASTPLGSPDTWLSAGYSMHVPKPVDPAELATVVASLADRG